jgi:hypothetical protein
MGGGPLNEPTVLFLLGVAKRCGTNFLFDLLKRHPDIDVRPPISEDYILHRIEPLIHFATNITELWQDWWQLDESETRRFVQLLGNAIESFLVEGRSARYVLVKTPSAANVHWAPLVFPRSPLIFLVRDGRSVCESTQRTFGKSVEEITRRWVDSGKLILDFLERYAEGTVPYLLVRYEDLVTDTEAQLRRVFEQLGLDAGCYDFAAASSIPVRGSSVLRGGASEVHWDPVEKSPDFDPLSRYRHWDRASLEAFMAAAGDVLEAFGYQTEVTLPP